MDHGACHFFHRVRGLCSHGAILMGRNHLIQTHKDCIMRDLKDVSGPGPSEFQWYPMSDGGPLPQW